MGQWPFTTGCREKVLADASQHPTLGRVWGLHRAWQAQIPDYTGGVITTFTTIYQASLPCDAVATMDRSTVYM